MPSNESSDTNGHSYSALCSVNDFVNREYDYIIVGGGTAGLCVAARLTENPDVNVAVLEAGKDLMEDPNVYTPSLYPTLIGREKYDWCYKSVPQPDAANKSYSMPRGKLLGGSSGINYLMYVRGSRADYDSWEALGNKGWGWEGMVPYFRKHQTLDPLEKAPKNPQFMPHAEKEKWHGTDGPIHTSFNDHYEPFEEDFCQAAYEVAGKPNTLKDAWSGDHMGFYSSLGAVNRTDDPGRRSYAATGYLRPNLHRRNLAVLTDAMATRIVLDGAEATGVEFVHNGQTRKISSTKEVILSGGVINSPQLLELSGIGDPDVLSKAGVECKVENKAVGANFQDHVLGGMLYDLAEGVQSMDAMHGDEFARAQQNIYAKGHNGPLGSPGMLMGFVSYASLVDKETLNQTLDEVRKHSHASTPFEKRQESEIVRQLADDSFANIQTFCIPCQLDLSGGEDQVQFFSAPPQGKQRVALLVCLEHPLSRGTVHITSSDPNEAPRIDTGYFRHPVDAKIMAEGIKWMGKVAARPVLRKSLGERVQPPADASIETEEERIEFVKNHISTQYHLCGSLAMGEAVDATLKVKGVQSLRVIDASIFPGHVSGNIMSTTYAVAEKGADLVKKDDGRYLAKVDSAKA